MSGWIGIYRAQFKTSFAQQLQYRVSLVLWLLGLVLEPTVVLVVWTTVARSHGGAVGGYDAAGFAAYFIIQMVVNHITFNWVAWDFQERIRLGNFSPLLLRPIHPIHIDIADNITYKILTSVVMFPATIGLIIAFQPAMHPPLWAILAFGPALLIAWALRFACEWALAMVAFWTTQVAAINNLYYLVMLFMSGTVVPLSLLPFPVQVVAGILPFRWMMAFPIELLLGRLSVTDALLSFGVQLLWLGLSLGILAVTWRIGIKRYSAVGA